MKIVLALAGMPGSGKTTCSDILKKKGFTVIIMGDAVRREMLQKGMELNNKTLREYVVKIRKISPNYVLDLINKELNDAFLTYDVVILDGVRNISEIKELKKRGIKTAIVGIVTDKNVRFERIKNRNNSTDMSSFEEFEWREEKELKYGVGDVLACSDYYVQNNSSIEELEHKINNLVVSIQ